MVCQSEEASQCSTPERPSTSLAPVPAGILTAKTCGIVKSFDDGYAHELDSFYCVSVCLIYLLLFSDPRTSYLLVCLNVYLYAYVDITLEILNRSSF